MADKHDKTEAPTPKKKREARKKGQIARSGELVMWAQLYAAAALLPAAVGGAGNRLRDLLSQMGHLIEQPDADKGLTLLTEGLLGVMLALTPLMLAGVVIGLAGHLAQTGLLFSGEGLKPKFERINPAKGLKKMFSPQSGWELAKTLIRTSILAGVAIPPVQRITQKLVEAGHPDLHTVLGILAADGLALMRATCMAGLVLAVVDYGLQRRRIGRMLRMSKQEVKDENRLSEGDPHIKQAIRARQHEMSRNRMMAAVPDATAVIVNPTHIAVAIKYEQGGRAPVVVAKGRGAIALRIREEAERHGVPILRDIPLARALHASCDLGTEIPLELYEAVAQVLALVMSLGAVGRRRADDFAPLAELEPV